MVFDGWFELGGTEIVNTARAAANATARGFSYNCDECPDIWYPLGHEPYMDTPSNPWLDNSAASQQFLGIAGLGTIGFDKSTATSRVSALVGDGAVLKGLIRPQRQVAIRVVLLAETEAGRSFGISWLASMLRGGNCTTDACGGNTLNFFSECPPCTSGDAFECKEQYLLQLFEVGVLDSPTVIKQGQQPCGLYFVEVEFVLVAGTPYIYRAPRLVASVDNTGWTTGALAYPSCSVTDPCPALTVDPDCVAQVAPPTLPPLSDTCINHHAGNYFLRTVSFNPVDSSPWFEKVVIIAGTTFGNTETATHNLMFWITPNPSAVACTSLNLCDADVFMHMPFRDSANFLVDSRAKRAYAIDGATTCNLPIYGRGVSTQANGLYTWPLMGCDGESQQYCLRIAMWADGGVTIDPATEIRVYIADRYDAV